jgi:hypothetical protein
MNIFAVKAVLGTLAAMTVAACGGGAALSDNERTYADACTRTLAAFGQSGKQSVCECAARIVVPQLTPAELKAFNTPPELSGKIMTAEATAPYGFTPADYGSMLQKTTSTKADVEQRCGT